MSDLKDLKIRWRLHGDETEPTTRQRGINVYRELQRQGYDADKWEVGEPADIIVLQYGMRLLDEALATGATVVTDINDQLFAPHHPYYKETMAGLQRVHAVVAGSPRLMEHLVRLHPFVRMIEEGVDPRYFAVKKQKHGGTNMLYMGLHDNIVYFNEIDVVLERLAKKHQFTVTFLLPPLDGQQRSNANKVKAKPYPTKFIPWTMEDLLEQMSLADIGLVPLFQQEWTWNKCCNKLASFCAASIACVATDVPSYRAVMRHGTDAMLAYTQEEWEGFLGLLLSDSGMRSRLSVAGKRRASQFLSIETIAGQWLELFQEIRPR